MLNPNFLFNFLWQFKIPFSIMFLVRIEKMNLICSNLNHFCKYSVYGGQNETVHDFSWESGWQFWIRSNFNSWCVFFPSPNIINTSPNNRKWITLYSEDKGWGETWKMQLYYNFWGKLPMNQAFWILGSIPDHKSNE